MLITLFLGGMFIIAAFIWEFDKLQIWFRINFPEFSNFIYLIVGFLGLWVIATIFTGFFGFMFVLLLGMVLFVDAIYNGFVAFIKFLFKK